MEKSLNNSLMVVTPRMPFATWAGALESREDVPEVGAVSEDGTAYLVPQVREVEDEDRILDQLHQRVFENELSVIVKDSKLWPPQRDLDTFLEWFDVFFHPAIFDLSEDAPKAE